MSNDLSPEIDHPEPQRGKKLVVALLLIGAVLLLVTLAQGPNPRRAAGFGDWSSFLGSIERGAVTRLELGRDRIVARLDPDQAEPVRPNSRLQQSPHRPLQVTVGYPGGTASESTLDEVRAAVERARAAGHRVAIAGSEPSAIPSMGWMLLIGLGLGGLGGLLMLRHRQRWQQMNATSSRGRSGPGSQQSPGRVIQRHQVGTRFVDVAGIDEAKEEIEEVVECLRDPRAFEAVGARIPSGLLLIGPPGTGKTLLAKALAGEAGCAFIEVSGSDFVEMLVGVGAARVRALFEQARRSAPCILFIDEIDAIARKRSDSGGHGGGSVEHEQTLNAFLVELDGFRSNEQVILVGATNRADVLDPAILRPGRCDRQVDVGLPDRGGRLAILGIHARKVKLASDVDLDRIARATPGFSGAGLANLVNEAAIHAARQQRQAIVTQDLEWARDKVAFGKEMGTRFRAMSALEKRITAYHEAGHAVVQLSLEHTDEIHKVTIVPRGQMLGAVMSLPDDDRQSQTRSRLLDQICVLYGGRVAEELFCDDITAGACNDIERATRIGHKMVFELGMSEQVGLIKYECASLLRAEEGHQVSEAAMQELDTEVKTILRHQHHRARSLVETHRDWIERIVEALMNRETLTGDQVRELQDVADQAAAFDHRRHDA